MLDASMLVDVNCVQFAALDAEDELAGSDDGVYEVDHWPGRNIDSKLNKFVQIADPQPLKISLC